MTGSIDGEERRADGSPGGPGADSENAASFVRDHNECAIALFGQLGAKQDNLIVSPFSVRTALAMAYAGAKGEAAAATAVSFMAGEAAPQGDPEPPASSERITPSCSRSATRRAGRSCSWVA